jgi:hypothetical protein
VKLLLSTTNGDRRTEDLFLAASNYDHSGLCTERVYRRSDDFDAPLPEDILVHFEGKWEFC